MKQCSDIISWYLYSWILEFFFMFVELGSIAYALKQNISFCFTISSVE